jgi:hypothetical protein
VYHKVAATLLGCITKQPRAIFWTILLAQSVSHGFE